MLCTTDRLTARLVGKECQAMVVPEPTLQQILQRKPSQRIISIGMDASTYEALQLMAEHDIGAIAVMEGAQLRGILTEREYARKIVLHGKASRHTPVRDTMATRFPRVPLQASVSDCMVLMTESRFRYVAVMEDERLLGLLSIGDLVKSVISEQQASIEHLQRYITGF